MKINFMNFAILLTFIGLFIFIWTPAVESKGGGGGGRGGGTGYIGSKQSDCDRICAWRKQQERGSSSNSGSSSSGSGSNVNIFQNIMKTFQTRFWNNDHYISI